MYWRKMAQHEGQGENGVTSNGNLDVGDILVLREFRNRMDKFEKAPTELLIRMGQIFNRMRAQYLRHLTQKIADELKSAVEDMDYVLNLEVPIYDEYSYDTWRNIPPESSLSFAIEKDIIEVADAIAQGKLTTPIVSKAKKYFDELPWSEQHDLQTWIDILGWTKKLYDSVPVDVDAIARGEVERPLEQMKRLAFMLNNINSLEAKTGEVFAETPDGNWLQWVLKY